MLVWTGQARRDHFPSSSARNGATCVLTSSISELNTGQRSPKASISVSMILLQVCTSSFLSSARCVSLLHSKDRWKVYKRGSPTPLWEFIILLTEEGRDTERCSLGDPVHGGEFSELWKRGRRDAGPKKYRSRVSDTKHNTAFMTDRHHHNAREEREVYFIVPATVPLLWKCTF